MIDEPILNIHLSTNGDDTPNEKIQRSIRGIESACSSTIAEIARNRASGIPIHELNSLIKITKVNHGAVDNYLEDFQHAFYRLKVKKVADARREVAE